MQGSIRKMLPALLLALSACWTREAVWEQTEEPQKEITRRGGETEAEALYRHGVNCMDVIERDPCAIDYFEQLVELAPPKRELVGDAIFRLVKLYRRNGDEERSTLLLRSFWDLGTESGSAGLLPYGTRFVPSKVTTLYMVDTKRLLASRLHKSLDADTTDTMFTCDEARREELREAAKARRAERQAERDAANPPTEKELEERAEREAKSKERREEYEKGPKPIFDEGLCKSVEAFGLTDPRELDTFVAAQNHEDPTVSAALYVVPELESALSIALANGKLQQESEAVFAMKDFEYEGKPAKLVRVDLNDVLMVPAQHLEEVREAHESRKTNLAPELVDLVDSVPRDVVFFTVLTKAAMEDGFDEMGTVLGGLMPDPQGLLMAAVVYDYAGVFVRMPTSDPVKGWALLSLARWMIGRQAEDAEGSPTAAILNSLDVSQTRDGRALQLTSVLTGDDVRSMFLD